MIKISSYKFKIIEANSRYSYYLFPSNSNTQEIGKSYNSYSTHKECLEALVSCRQLILSNKYEVAIDCVDNRYVPILNDGNRNTIFYRILPYNDIKNANLWESLIVNNIDADLK